LPRSHIIYELDGPKLFDHIVTRGFLE